MIIDWKAHILPGLDRKCDSHVKAIQLMIYAKRAGVDKLVAMPFYEAGTDLRQFIEMRDEAFASVRGLVGEDMPELVLGTEFKYDKQILDTDGVELLKETPCCSSTSAASSRVTRSSRLCTIISVTGSWHPTPTLSAMRIS